MKYLSPYKIFESDDRRDEVKNRISGRRDQAKAAIPEFIIKMSEVINTNYEIYDIDEDLIMSTFQSYLTADKGKKKIEYRDICGDLSDIDNTGRVVSLILNYGYSIGYFCGNLSSSDVDVQFNNFISDIFKCLHFERVSSNKLSYNGPVVLSSSITASSFGTKTQIDRMDDMIERYYHGDKEVGELSVLIGCIYQYGYGLGNDTSYMENMIDHDKILAILKQRGVIKESKTYTNVNKTQEFFSKKINWELINALKDISLDYLDEGDKLSYSVNVEVDPSEQTNSGIILMGQFQTRDDKVDWDNMGPYETEIVKRQLAVIPKDFEHWINLFDEHYNKAVKQWEKSNKFSYGIMLQYQADYGGRSSRNKKGQLEILKRMKSMFPDETIYIAV
jgi:hypothetical protein